MKALVDSGASISCIDYHNLLKSGLTNKFSIKPSTTRATSASGQSINIMGTITLPISIAKLTLIQTFYVVDNSLPVQIILGDDFLNSQKTTKCYETHKLILQGGITETPLITQTPNTSGLHRTYIVNTHKPLTVPANSLVTFSAGFQHKHDNNTNCLPYILQPLPKVHNKFNLALARAIVTPSNTNKITCTIMNHTDNAIYLPTKTRIAKITPLFNSTLMSIDTTTDNNKAENDTQEYIRIAQDDLGFNFSNTDLTTAEQNELYTVIGQNRNAFAKSVSEMGITNIYKHVIDTGDANPIRQRFYRTSPQIKREIEKQVDELLANKLISKSFSQWSSPCLLVKKADGTYRFAVDYRKLNTVCRTMSHPLPTLQEIYDCIGEAKAQYMSVLDIKQSFWTVGLDPKTAEKSTFTCHKGNYK